MRKTQKQYEMLRNELKHKKAHTKHTETKRNRLTETKHTVTFRNTWTYSEPNWNEWNRNPQKNETCRYIQNPLDILTNELKQKKEHTEHKEKKKKQLKPLDPWGNKRRITKNYKETSGNTWKHADKLEHIQRRLYTLDAQKHLDILWNKLKWNARGTRKRTTIFRTLRTHSKMCGSKRKYQGTDFKNNTTTKQESHREYYCLKNFIWTNRKRETIFYLLPIGRNKIVKRME